MKKLRTGFTTGTCAAAAAKAAALLLTRQERNKTVEIALPGGARVCLPVEQLSVNGDRTRAAVRKDAGDDPDSTHGVLVEVCLSPAPDGCISFAAGEGVGTVTKPGLSVKPGEPAINPVPRLMIERAIREVTDAGMLVTVVIPGGRTIARRTFNPRLGIEGGLSVLGTTGIVRPYSVSSVRASLACALDVATACAITSPVFVPGNLGRKAVEKNFLTVEQQVIEAGNEWGFLIDSAAPRRFEKILIAGHPGKLVKLAAGYWDTHSARSCRAVDIVVRRAEVLFGKPLPAQITAEGIFSSLSGQEAESLADSLADAVRMAVLARMEAHPESAGAAIPAVAAALTDMQGRIVGTAGELAPWR